MASIESRAPELKAIDAHAQELTTSLSADPVCVAEALAGKRFIQSEVLLIKMLRDDTPTVRAAILVEAVRKEIGLAPDKFSQFLEILSEVTCAKGVTESLRSTYQKYSKQVSRKRDREQTIEEVSHAENNVEYRELPPKRKHMDIQVQLQPESAEKRQGQLNQVDDNGSDKSVDVASKLETLENQFDDLQTRIINELSAKSGITVQELLNQLTSLPLSLRKEYEASIAKCIPSMSTDSEMLSNELFMVHLNPLTSFIDYGLVECVIRKFGSDILRNDMQSYCYDVQTFMKETTIKQLIHFWPGKHKVPENFEVLKTKIGKNANTCTLDEMSILKGRFCAEVKLSEVIFSLIAVEESNSFVISWLTPAVLIHDLIEASRKIEERFFDEEYIVSVSIGNRWLYNPKQIHFSSKLRGNYQQSQGSPSPVQWIPSPTKKIFRLAMIQRKRVQRGHIEDRFVRMTISGSIDDILHTKSPVELEHIFRNTLHGGEIILIEGAPGSGKSTLTVHICQRWGKGELFQQFTVVILVQLRDPAVQRAQTIADLLPVENVTVAQELGTELIATNGRGVLWILDGWDELPTRLQQVSIFYELIKGMLSECSVIVTSRPISSGDLHPIVSSRFEVLGFTPEEQRQYFTECLKGDTKALEALLEKIQENPMVQSICYLPLNAAFVVYTFKHKSQSLPNTQYEIYLSVILHCIRRHFEREGWGHGLPTELASLDDLFRSEVVREPFQCLCELAYCGVMENKVTFSSSDLPQGSNTLSLLQAIESFLESGKSVFYNFLHLSIQEVLSAYYIATWLTENKQVSKFRYLFNKPRFAAVFQFYAAITKLNSPEIRQIIAAIVEARFEPLLISLLHCLYEAQDSSLCLFVAEKLEYNLDLSETSLSSLDNICVSFFLSCTCALGMEVSVNLCQCSVGDLGASYVAKYLGSDVDHVGKVSSILLDSNKIHEEGASHIARILYCIKHLSLSRNPIGDTGASFISEAVRETATLKTLILCNCDITSSGAEDLSRALAQNSSLVKLDISDNYLGDEGISHVAGALKQNKQLKELWISNCEMTDEGTASLASALSVNNSLKMLHIINRTLTEDGLATITQSLVNNSEFVKLIVSSQFGSAIAFQLTKEVNEARRRSGLQSIEIEAGSRSGGDDAQAVEHSISALIKASKTGDIDTVKRLLKAVNLRYDNKMAVLMAASKNGHATMTALLLDHGIGVDILDENGKSALMIASQHGHAEVAEVLLQHGAQLNLQDRGGLSCLMMASERGHHNVTQLLIKHGIQMELKSMNGWTALMYAGWNNHIDILQTLLKHGAHVKKEFLTQLSPSKHHGVLEILNQLDTDPVQQRHLAAVQLAINKQGSLTHTTVHGVFVGIARSGKDSLMKRLLGETVDKTPSTGVAEKAIQIRVEKSSFNTVSACVEDSKWIRLTQYDDEAIEMMTQLTAKQTEAVKPTQIETVELAKYKSNAKDFDSKTDVLIANPMLAKSDENHRPTSPKEEAVKKHKPIPNSQSEIPLVHKSPIEIFKEALKTRKSLRQHLENHWSMYLSNTGGQMEFQELLPLLVSGPSMFFVTFRLDRDLKQRYEIEYEVVKSSDGSHPKIFKYTSSATPLETVLQTLASIDAVGTYEYSNQKRERAALTYKVFIVGTHRDLLERSLSNTQAVQSKIKEINQILIDSVKSASYFPNIVVLPGDQMIFTVNNFSTSDDDFKCIRSSVEQEVNKGDFAMTSPSHWLIYSLVLRQLKSQIESYDNCYRIAKDCGITDDDEFKEALHFIHTKMGIIRYFPVDDLKSIVILDPQVLFDKVTELIVETFTSERTDHQSIKDFKKGIFSFSEFEKISRRRNPDPLLTPKRFARLLEHLRIAAPFYENCRRTKCKILKYFFPCALSHVDEVQEQSTVTDCGCIPPLVVSFECSYRPMGLAGALIKYLMTNERGSKDFEWKLLTEKIYRDQVSFGVKPYHDTITLKMFPTHIEVTCLPRSDNSSRHQDCLIEKVCIEVCKTIKAGIETVNSDINYINNTEPLFTFYCQLCSSCTRFKHHPAELECFQNNPIKLYCLETDKPHDLPSGHEVWQLLELMTPIGADDSTQIPLNIDTGKSIAAVPATQPSLRKVTRCDSRHHAILYDQLKSHASQWRDIGTYLGFMEGELSTIQGAPKHYDTAPESWLRAMLSKWLVAPSPQQGSDHCATLEALKDAVSKAGFGSTAESLTISDTSHSVARGAL